MAWIPLAPWCFPLLHLGAHPGIGDVKGGLDAKSGSTVYQPHWFNTVELWGHNFLGQGKYVIMTHCYKPELVGKSSLAQSGRVLVCQPHRVDGLNPTQTVFISVTPRCYTLLPSSNFWLCNKMLSTNTVNYWYSYWTQLKNNTEVIKIKCQTF
jgi:hypothetical protein